MVAEIDADTLARLMDADAVQVVDVRQPPAYASGHIPEAENVPFETLLDDIDGVDWHDRVVFVCPYGERSRQAAQLLAASDKSTDETEIYNLADGLIAWDGPLVRSEST